MSVAQENILEKKHSRTKKKQCTLLNVVSISGTGLFTGEKATVTLLPAEINTGIVFKRVDLPLKPYIPAQIDFVVSTPRCTLIEKDGFSVQTIEHLLSALRAFEIDNVIIEITGPEVPILDGSSYGFVEMIEKGGVCEQGATRNIYKLEHPIFWSKEHTHLIALPSDEYKISYTLHYPHSPLINSQYYSFCCTFDSFKKEIAPCRTFSLYEEILPMIEKGIIKGGSLENGVIIKGDSILNPEGIRFPDEMVRHKILDMIGDLSLIEPFLGHIIAIRSGHTSNHAFAKELARIKMEIS